MPTVLVVPTMSNDLPDLLPHGPLEPLFDDVWTLQGAADMAPLVRLTRRMTVVRSEGELTLINAVRLSDAGRAELDALGTVRNVVRIGVHGMDDAWYADTYDAVLWALPDVENGHGRPIAERLSEDHLPFPGCALFTLELTNKPEAALLHTGHGLLITCDSVQNWESTEGCSLMAKAVTHLMGFMKPAQLGPPWRKMMTPTGGTLRPDFERLHALDFQHLVGGHGVPLRDHAKERLGESIERELG